MNEASHEEGERPVAFPRTRPERARARRLLGGPGRSKASMDRLCHTGGGVGNTLSGPDPEAAPAPKPSFPIPPGWPVNRPSRDEPAQTLGKIMGGTTISTILA